MISVVILQIKFQFPEAIMTTKRDSESSEKQHKSNSSAFLVYAVVVFSILAGCLVVILMRSSA